MDNVNNNIKKLIDSGNLAEAETALSDALRQSPDSPELHNLQAELKLKTGSLYWEKGEEIVQTLKNSNKNSHNNFM